MSIWILISNILGNVGVAVFIYFLLNGLKNIIGTQKATIAEMSKTMQAMERRITETEKIGDMYKMLITDMPEMIGKLKNTILFIKDATIKELEDANKLKDDQLSKVKTQELKKLEVAEQALTDLPNLRDELIQKMKVLEEKIETVQSVNASMVLGTWKPTSLNNVYESLGNLYDYNISNVNNNLMLGLASFWAASAVKQANESLTIDQEKKSIAEINGVTVSK